MENASTLPSGFQAKGETQEEALQLPGPSQVFYSNVFRIQIWGISRYFLSLKAS